ncbi:MAG TPA: hypothetical protein VHQ02_15610 [Usitatibacter sp.]|jgi:hypothetical protein|nr:hypothetical protein [Usitatibacter sp.]
MNRACTLSAAAMLTAALAAPCAHARVDAKCYNEWNGALITQQIGQKCNYADAAAVARLEATQSARMQCALKNATAADQADVNKRAAHAQADSVQRVAQTQCSADTRKVYDRNVSRFAH